MNQSIIEGGIIRELSEEQATKEARKFFKVVLTEEQKLDCARMMVERIHRSIGYSIYAGEWGAMKRQLKREYVEYADRLTFDAWKAALSVRWDAHRGKYLAMSAIRKP